MVFLFLFLGGIVVCGFVPVVVVGVVVVAVFVVGDRCYGSSGCVIVVVVNDERS